MTNKFKITPFFCLLAIFVVSCGCGRQAAPCFQRTRYKRATPHLDHVTQEGGFFEAEMSLLRGPGPRPPR
jgi:hypothetical protein